MRRERWAIAVIAVCLATIFGGSTLVTPLYPAYQQLFAFSDLTLTLVYSAYVVGNLFTLLFMGQLSDRRGRRAVVLAAIGVALASTLLFLCARSEAWLACGRMLSGAAVGLTSGTAAAWLADLHSGETRSRAATLAVVGNMAGLAAGALLSGLLSEYAPWPLQLPFVIYLAILVLLALLTWLPPETVSRTSPAAGSHALSLRPRIGVPLEIRARFFPPAATLFCSMAVLGFYAALIPGILKRDLHEPSHAVSGGVIFELALISAFTVHATRNFESRKAMLTGLALLLPCVTLLVAAQASKSMPILLAGTTLAGIAIAFAYRGSLQVVNEIAPQARRAEIVSAYMLCGFAGNSLPVIGVGILSGLMSSLRASIVFACVIAALSIAGLTIARKARARA